MQMSNMAELITVAKYWRDWADGRWVMCVFNNEDLNQVTWEQRVMEGDPKFDASQDIPNVPYHRFAEMIGLKGIYVDDPERFSVGRSLGGEASSRAGSQDGSGRPTVAPAHHPRRSEEILA
jgi:thiamine pyrophosphate-dependent acetolactate synthase large subunit-like protein